MSLLLGALFLAEVDDALEHPGLFAVRSMDDILVLAPTRWQLCFGPFRLDVQDARLWQGAQAIRLRPKSFAVLRYLLERAGRLVAKEELLHGVWPELAVGEYVLTACLREIRQALGDDARRPQYIETAHRQRYRFIASVLEAGVDAGRAGAAPTAGERTVAPSPLGLVGREAELARLHACLAQASSGQRQVVFVTGEGGLGKTTLVDGFLAQATATAGLCSCKT